MKGIWRLLCVFFVGTMMIPAVALTLPKDSSLSNSRDVEIIVAHPVHGGLMILRHGQVVGEVRNGEKKYYPFPMTGPPGEKVIQDGKVIGVYDIGGAIVFYGNPTGKEPPPWDEEEFERSKNRVDELEKLLEGTPTATEGIPASPLSIMDADDNLIAGRRADIECNPYAPYPVDPNCYVRHTLGDKYPGSPENYLLTYGVMSCYDNSSRPAPPGRQVWEGCAAPYEWAIVDWFYLCRARDLDTGFAYDFFRTDTGPNQWYCPKRILDLSYQGMYTIHGSSYALAYGRTWVRVNYYNV